LFIHREEEKEIEDEDEDEGYQSPQGRQHWSQRQRVWVQQPHSCPRAESSKTQMDELEIEDIAVVVVSIPDT